MKVLIAMDSFKGSLTSVEACGAVERGILRADKSSEIVKIPMADGGEGTIEAFIAAAGGFIAGHTVSGLFGEKIKGYYGVINEGKTAVVETAVASGITLVKPERLNPMEASTFGTGEIILKAINDGFKDIIVGLGGSATNDGGLGALQALGIKFLGENGAELGRGGKMLSKVRKIDTSGMHPMLGEITITLACDVDNPFCGKSGAAYVFAPQKGADAQMVKILDEGLKNLANVINKTFGKDISNVRGAGAAGGLCGGLLAFTNAVVKPGFEILREASDLDNKLKNADLVITGEGKTDIQTTFGKLPAGVANAAKKYDKKVICISGSVAPCDELYRAGIDAMLSIVNQPMSLDDAIKNAKSLLEQASFDIMKCCLF